MARTPTKGPKRTTIRDIARLAEVSPGAVSLALNHKPGVSATTRERVFEVAQELGWAPSQAARALSSAKALAVGLIIARPRASMDAERFYFQFICGMESVLSQRGYALELQIVDDVTEEVEAYRRWWAQRSVAAVVLVDARRDDPRPAVLAELGLPFASVGTPFPGGGVVLIDDAAIVMAALDHLVECGCQRIAYVCGYGHLLHTQRRQRAFLDHGAAIGVETVLSDPTDYSEALGATETEHVLTGGLPDAIIYDNEILTLGGLSVLMGHGLAIPGDIRVLSLEDSPVCRVVTPQVTAFVRDPFELGAAAAELALLGEADVRELPIPELAIRASTLG